jgi:hypothetical protein
MKGFRQYAIKGQVVTLISENHYQSSRNTKYPKQVWEGSINGRTVCEGMGSAKDALAVCERYIKERMGL